MAQIDKLHYCSTLFWFLIIFWGGYLFFIFFIVPKIYKSIRIRYIYLDMLHNAFYKYYIYFFSFKKLFMNMISKIILKLTFLFQVVYSKCFVLNYISIKYFNRYLLLSYFNA